MKSYRNKNDFAVVAVPSVEEACKLLLSTGLFDAFPGSDSSVIDKSMVSKPALSSFRGEPDAPHAIQWLSDMLILNVLLVP